MELSLEYPLSHVLCLNNGLGYNITLTIYLFKLKVKDELIVNKTYRF